MRISILLAVLGLVLTQVAMAQVEPQRSLWQLNSLHNNPGSSANLYSLDASINYRKQWLELPGSPNSAQATIGAPLYIINSGLYLGVQHDEVGVRRNTTLRGGFSYKLINSDQLSISVGAAAALRQSRIDGSALRTADGIYEGTTVSHLDPRLDETAVSGSAVGFDVGVEAIYSSITVGVSVLNLNEPIADLTAGSAAWPRQANAYVNALIPVAELVELEAGAILYSDFRDYQGQANVIAWYDSNIGVGAAFRGLGASTLDAVSLLLGWRPSESVTVAYSYDYGLSELSGVHDNTHEFVLRYVMATPIGKGKLPPVIYNPRL